MIRQGSVYVMRYESGIMNELLMEKYDGNGC